MSNAAFVLMNCDLVAVPLQIDRGEVVTVYCGARRALQLQGDQAQDGSARAGYAGFRASSPILDRLSLAPKSGAQLADGAVGFGTAVRLAIQNPVNGGLGDSELGRDAGLTPFGGGLDLAEHVSGGLGIHAIHPIREWIGSQYPNE
jgi:hypothetical protein